MSADRISKKLSKIINNPFFLLKKKNHWLIEEWNNLSHFQKTNIVSCHYLNLTPKYVAHQVAVTNYQVKKIKHDIVVYQKIKDLKRLLKCQSSEPEQIKRKFGDILETDVNFTDESSVDSEHYFF